MSEEQKSPLLEADPERSIAEIFSRDPEELTRLDRDKAVAALRKQRVEFAAADAAPKEKKAKKPPAEKKESVSLEDLDLG